MLEGLKEAMQYLIGVGNEAEKGPGPGNLRRDLCK